MRNDHVGKKIVFNVTSALTIEFRQIDALGNFFKEELPFVMKDLMGAVKLLYCDYNHNYNR